jgi:hypothetical protein
MEELHTTADVMDALGGNDAVAEITCSKPKAVWNWRFTRTFPSRTYLILLGALNEVGKTAPASLWGMKLPSEKESAE